MGEPSLLADWSAENLCSVLRSLGLAPVKVSDPTQRMLGCRYATLLPELSSKDLQDFFEVTGWHPQLLRSVVARSSKQATTLAGLLETSTSGWGPRACADAALALALAADVESQDASAGSWGCAGCACVDKGPRQPKREFRTEQPEQQLQVIMRAARNFRQGSVKQTVARPEMPVKNPNGLWMPPEPTAPAARLAGGICQAPWALPAPGRRSQHMLEQQQSSLTASRRCAELLGKVLPALLGRLRAGSAALAELPGSPMPAAMLEGEPPAPETLGGPEPSKMLTAPSPAQALPCPELL